MTDAPYSVYWITDDLDSDMFNHGYVGITNRGVDTRYKEHIRLAFNKKYKSYWRELSKAIRLFGENLFVKTICICDREYAKQIENKLRPVEHIGWNLAIGGCLPYPVSEEVKALAVIKRRATGRYCSGERHHNWKGGVKKKRLEKIAENKRLKELGLWKRPPITEETREKMRHRRRGIFVMSDWQQELLKEANHKKYMEQGPWTVNNARPELWALADIVYQAWMEKPCGGKAIASRLNLKFSKTYNTMIREFSSGWIPRYDERWLNYYGK